jgi:hypothetical protein
MEINKGEMVMGFYIVMAKKVGIEGFFLTLFWCDLWRQKSWIPGIKCSKKCLKKCFFIIHLTVVDNVATVSFEAMLAA